MTQKTFTPNKKIYKSKMNWLFILLGTITASPELISSLNVLTHNTFLPIVSIVGIVLRTYFTNTKLVIK